MLIGLYIYPEISHVLMCV